MRWTQRINLMLLAGMIHHEIERRPCRTKQRRRRLRTELEHIQKWASWRWTELGWQQAVGH